MRRIWPYLVLLFIFGFDLWVEHSIVAEEFFGNWIKPFTDEKKFSVIWTILIVVGLLIFGKDLLKIKEEQVQKKEEEKKELEARMRSRMEMLVMANQELSAYRERDILLKLFRRFVSTNAYVIGVQLFEYTQQHIGGKSEIKLSLLNGYVREKIDVNAAQQIYYLFDIGLFREFRDAYEKLYTVVEFTPSEEEQLSFVGEEHLTADPSALMEFIQKYYKRLSAKSETDYTDEDAIEYAFLVVGVRLLERAAGEEIDNNLAPEKIEVLESFMRTGYLQAALAGIPISFSHRRRNSKADRQYISSRFHIDDRRYVYMILLDPEILNDGKKEEILDILTDEFESKLEKTFSAIYNGIRDVEGDDENAEVERR